LNLETGHTIARSDSRNPPIGFDAKVLDAFGHEPRTIDALVAGLNASPMVIAVALGRLQQAGWVEETAGWWEALTAR
jgi:predicted Rossmann fold nucleotide-binding protein DprA/Smf involved in DNA uptake